MIEVGQIREDSAGLYLVESKCPEGNYWNIVYENNKERSERVPACFIEHDPVYQAPSEIVKEDE